MGTTKPNAQSAADERDDLVATLVAFRKVKNACWPTADSALERTPAAWGMMSTSDLRAELGRLVEETEQPGRDVRVFWKLGPDFVYGGCNRQFAQDGGLASADELVGRNDFDPVLSWQRQSAKYRRDDVEVVTNGTEKLDIIERQDGPAGTIWVRTSKAAIISRGGRAIGLLGMYQVIDGAAAARLSRGRT